MASSNIKEVITWLEGFVHSFNFELPGRDMNMGRDIAHIVAGRIQERSSRTSGGANGQRWKPISDKASIRGVVAGGVVVGGESYKERKRKAYGWMEADGRPGYRTAQMLSQESLFGDTRVEPYLIEMRYGLNVPPQDCKSPHDNRRPSEKKADESVTDRQKGEWFTAGGRTFYELDDQIRDAVLEEARQHLIQYIQTKG
jgi:hypothetical protein